MLKNNYQNYPSIKIKIDNNEIIVYLILKPNIKKLKLFKKDNSWFLICHKFLTEKDIKNYEIGLKIKKLLINSSYCALSFPINVVQFNLDNEFFYLFGDENQKIKILWNIIEKEKSKIELIAQNSIVIIKINKEKFKNINVRKELIYKALSQILLAKLTIMTHEISKKLNTFTPDIKIKNMISKWGYNKIEKNNKRSITYNFKLFTLPEKIVEYVVIHELTHNIHMNHSKNFYIYAEKFFHNFKELDKKLKTYQVFLN
ncbi:YgjP-like metallopeptidase domain-containing protein [Mycoplasmopsis meleagridis]|uniref:YgjP-like metallopeptidase domain-containing protein n=1 Tax=Mycoplasmopsis meleagridis TaxID=29561 RepID=UPI00073D4529|nr:YgjP-like metallopeptidase domain-containing protein [Mycoplasmopsis meleagridis]KUH47308.1 hypothetical protein ASB56_02205 [Mycoplasmopsis meleagridis]